MLFAAATDSPNANAVCRLVHGGYDGTVILDHTPPFTGDGDTGIAATAFAVGYIKASLRAAHFELTLAKSPPSKRAGVGGAGGAGNTDEADTAV